MNQGFFLFKEGDPGNFFYIVKEGELELTYNTNEKKIIRKGESFGELDLIQKNLRSGTIKSLTDVEVYCLEAGLFKNIVLKMNNIDLKERISFVRENLIFRYLDTNQLHDIARNMLKYEYDKNHKISEKDIEDSLFIIKQGNISISNENTKEKTILKEKDYFGLSALLFSDFKAKNVISETYSKCYQLTRGILIDILGEDYLNKILQGICKDALTRVKMIKILSLDEYFSKVFSLMKLRKFIKGEMVFSLDNHINKKIILLIEGKIKNVRNFYINIYLKEYYWRNIS